MGINFRDMPDLVLRINFQIKFVTLVLHGASGSYTHMKCSQVGIFMTADWIMDHESHVHDSMHVRHTKVSRYTLI